MSQIIINNPLDMHLHLRDGEILSAVLPYSAKNFSAALVMPNLNPPILDSKSAIKYKNEILKNCQQIDNCSNFEPIMSLYLNEDLNEDELKKARDENIRILKLYPKGVTTNSQNGISNILSDKMLKILHIAQKYNFILCVHGECSGFCMNREFDFLEIFKELATNFKNLKIIIEHISDRHSINLVEKYDNLYATITPHHVLLTLDDLIGNNINIFNFCKPIVKTQLDKDAILQTALSAHPKFSFGSDSAPHTIESKINNGAAGIFHAPILLPLMASIFNKYNKLENLQSFISNNAIKIYDLTIKYPKSVVLDLKTFKIMDSIESKKGNIAVFMANSELDYDITNVTTI